MPLEPTRCCCEIISFIFVGLILEAKGSVFNFSHLSITILTEKMIEWDYIIRIK